MPYRVRVSARVQKELDDLPLDAYRRVRLAILALGDNPRPVGVKKLQGMADTFRLRVGDYRIVYEVIDGSQEVRLETVADRKDVYR